MAKSSRTRADPPSFRLYLHLIESKLGGPLEAYRPRQLSGMDAVRALWPLNQVFHPWLTAIRSLPYDAAFEPEADAAIESLVKSGSWPPNWADISGPAWRVMLERYLQGLSAAINNEKSGNSVMAVPEQLAGTDVTLAVMTFVMHGMKLLWPPMDRSKCELHAGATPDAIRVH